MSRHPRHPRPPRTTALIAEDEPLLAASLQAELARLWPDLQVLASVGDGHSALAQALALRPNLLFFDIRMPGLSGLDAAAALADAWDTTTPGAKPFPALVFVTAYDQYAVQPLRRRQWTTCSNRYSRIVCKKLYKNCSKVLPVNALLLLILKRR